MRACWQPMGARSTSDLLLIAGAGGFAALLLALFSGALAAPDLFLALAIGEAGRSAPWLVEAFKALTWLGDGQVRLVIAAGGVLWLALRGHGRAAIWLMAVVVSGAGVAALLKILIARPRPAFLGALDHVSSLSFPSGHAWNATILFGALALLAPAPRRRAALALAILVAGLIGLSRIVLGVHWPSDVLAGWCGGVAWLGLGLRGWGGWISSGNRR